MGSPGRETLKRCLRLVREQHQIHACIANGENAAGGFGITAQTAAEMFETGVDVITGGNHTFDKREVAGFLEESDRVLRPANYPEGTPGRGHATYEFDGVRVGVLNLMGRVFMPALDDPFRIGRELIAGLRAQSNVIVVDVHAEATSEKMALGRLFDGSASVVYGTHTHVQTADEQIFSGGTAYLTDVGMTGPTDGVIGMATKPVLDRFTTALSERFSVEKNGPRQFCAAVVSVDRETGSAQSIRRVYLRGVA
jgi:metallophosphoesterase (TIGR00282 family)